MKEGKIKILRIIYDFADENVQTEGLSPGPYELTISQGKNPNYKIYVLTGNLNGKNIKANKFKYTLSDGRVEVYNLPRAIWKFGPFISSSVLVLPFYFYLKIFRGVDIVHDHQQMGVWFLVYKYLFGWLDKTPMVHTNHASIKGREMIAVSKGEKLGFMTKYFEYPIHKFNDFLSTKVANVLIAVSDDTLRELKDFYNPKQPIAVVENSVSIDRFKKEGELIDYGFEKGSKILFNIGRLSKRKGIGVLVESLALLPNNFKLVLAGIWEGDYQEYINNLITKLGLKDRVKFIGKISNFKAPIYYRSADIFVLASDHEGLPKVAIEALASGNKVVGTHFKLSHEVPNILYLKEKNPKELARGILEIDKKENRYKETRKVIEEFYSWDSKAKDIDKIYRDLLV